MTPGFQRIVDKYKEANIGDQAFTRAMFVLSVWSTSNKLSPEQKVDILYKTLTNFRDESVIQMLSIIIDDPPPGMNEEAVSHIAGLTLRILDRADESRRHLSNMVELMK